MVFLHCGRLDGPDLRTVHLLARASLGVKRTGGQARLAFVSTDLRRLIAFVGLEAVLLIASGFPPRG